MTIGESNHTPEILCSYETKKKHGRVIGFDLGSSVLGCSISNDKNSATASLYKHWGEKKAESYPACIQYKNWSPSNSQDVKVGTDALPQNSAVNNEDINIPSVKSYVIQWITEGPSDERPNVDLVLSDFFKAVGANIEKGFTVLNQDTSSKDSPYSLDDFRFCFAVPDGLTCKQEYTNLIRQAFKQANFLADSDADDRLLFVNDAVAVGYYCLATPRIFSGIEFESNYLVVDIGYHSSKFSVVKAQTTDAASTVLSSTASGAVGYRSLNDSFRSYVTEKSETLGLDKTNPNQIDNVVESFENYKKNLIDLDANESTFFECDLPVEVSNADLKEFVFKPFLDGIFKLIYEICQANGVKQIFFRGQYCEYPFFFQRCQKFEEDAKQLKTVPACRVWEEQPKNMVSLGAVSFGLRSPLTQIPVLIGSPNLNEPPKNEQPKNDQSPSEPSGNQDGDKRKEFPEGHFAVGIDFGTTFSGCSYADLHSIRREIVPVESWDKAQVYPKMSTTLRYNEFKDKFSDQWGYDALKARKKNGDVNLEYFKLLLSPKNVDIFYGKGNRDIQEVMAKLANFKNNSPKDKKSKHMKSVTPVDIIAEYLRNFNIKIRQIINSECKVSFKIMKLHYVLTVPAMWTETGKATMRQAAIQGGLVGKNDTVQLITEPEAAALACEKFMKETLKLKDSFYRKTLNFVVCDAGGGTVDLVTFSQQRIGDKDHIHQMGDGSGDTCGAAHLDKNFRDLIETFYTRVMGVGNLTEEFYKVHTDYFNDKLKLNFMPDAISRRKFTINLPTLPKIAGSRKSVPEFKSTCQLLNNNTEFVISERDIKDLVFDPVVQSVLTLLDKQIKENNKTRPDAVLLVGGFGQSRYLQQKIKAYCTENNIHLCVPPKGVTAISQGAVSYLLDPRLVSKKIATSSYAIQVDLADRKNTRSHLAYFIRKGTLIETERTLYTQIVSVKYPESAIIALFSKDTDVPNTDKQVETFQSNTENDIKKIAEYIIDLPECPSIKKGTPVELEVSLKMTVQGIFLSVKSKNKNIKIEEFGTLEEEGAITFKRIQPDPLNIHLPAEKVRFSFNIFSVANSK